MKSQAREILWIGALVVVGLYFVISGLTAASAFLAPLTIALVTAMVLIPLTRKMEGWGLSRALASLVSVLLSFVAVGVIIGVLSIQIQNVADDWPRVMKNIRPGIESVQKNISELTGISSEKQEAFLESNIPFSSGEHTDSEQQQTTQKSAQKSSEESGVKSQGKEPDQSTSSESAPDVSPNTIGMVGEALMSFFSGLGTFLLVFIYIFFLLLYRRKIKKSILKFFPEKERKEAELVLLKSIKLSEQYLLGRLLLITFLAVIYGVGLAIVGIENVLFISVFAALLSLVPYVGNIVGFGLALTMAAFTGGGIGMYIGVMVTFGIAQFVESYILEPYVVGEKVDLNPLATILVVVVGGSVWGVAGMVISIPVFGIIKIISDHIPALEPIGYALGEEDVADDNLFSRLGRKIKRRWKK